MKFTRIIVALVLAGSVWLASCKKEFENILPEDFSVSSKANIRVYSGALNTNRNYIYADNIPLTGVVFAFLGIWPTTGQYAAIDAGNRNITIKDTAAATTQNPINFSANLAAGKHYSVFIYDTTTSVKHILVEDNVTVPADTTARLRFANLVYSATPIPNVDVYSAKRGENIFTNVPVASVTDFIPYASLYTDSLYVRETGTTTDLAPVLSITPNIKRGYTVVFRGRYETTTGATTSIRRYLSSFTTF